LPLLDLGDDALAAVRQLLQLAGSPQLGLAPRPRAAARAWVASFLAWRTERASTWPALTFRAST
jgi:hypothetical protein